MRHLVSDSHTQDLPSLWCRDAPDDDGFVLLAAAHDVRPALALGIGVIALDRCPPDLIRKRLGESGLDSRLTIGVGAGAPFDAPLARVREAVAQLRHSLPNITIAVAALGPQMCRLAGEIADVALFNWVTPAYAKTLAQLVQDGAAAAQRSTPQLATYVRTAITLDDAQRALGEAAQYARYPQYARHFAAMGSPRESELFWDTSGGNLADVQSAYACLDLVIARSPAQSPLESVEKLCREVAAVANSPR